ncbi:MAG: class I SAM-dependent methyltransferase [Bacteroidota bacterium]
MNFDRVATFYDRLARLVFGRWLDQSRRLILSELPVSQRTLIIGAGSGDMLFALSERKILSQVVFLEPSRRFLRQAQVSWGHKPYHQEISVQWENRSLQAYHTKENFDLITTDYFLDLFREAECKQLLKKIDDLLTPDGYWLNIDFCHNEHTAWWWKPIRCLMYRFFALAAGVPARRLEDVGRLAREQGFVCIDAKWMAAGGIEVSLWRKAFKEH